MLFQRCRFVRWLFGNQNHQHNATSEELKDHPTYYLLLLHWTKVFKFKPGIKPFLLWVSCYILFIYNNLYYFSQRTDILIINTYTTKVISLYYRTVIIKNISTNYFCDNCFKSERIYARTTPNSSIMDNRNLTTTKV